MPSLVNSFYAQIFKIWRRKRFALFVGILSPRSDQRLLDVGGDPTNWTIHPVMLGAIDTLNLYDAGWQSKPEYHLRTLIGDGCAMEFPDKSYDIAYSNSVIEHVGPWERQQAFAKEIRRVGKSIWVQTPAFECPIEPHYLAPFVHWIPRRFHRTIVRWLTPYGLLDKQSLREKNEFVDMTRLLTKSEMRELFPDCMIHTERILGLIPKSYIAFRTETGMDRSLCSRK